MSLRETLVVTGVSSFIGTTLASHFSRAGRRVLGTMAKELSEYDPMHKQRIQAATSAGVELRFLDITNGTALQKFIELERPAVWVQHAGWAVDYGSPTYDLERGHCVNVKPLGGLFALLRVNSCRGVIVTGSSAEYTDSDHACEEDDACWPTTSYGLSKLAETIRARQLAHEHGLRTRVARVFIPYGSMDAPAKLIPSVVNALKSGKSVDLSPCEQSRDFIHVEDLARGYAALIDDIQREEIFDLFNLCSGQPIQLRQFLLEVATSLHADHDLLLFGRRPMRPREFPFSYGSNAKARTVLGWRPRALQEGLDAYLHSTGETSESQNVILQSAVGGKC